jgi:5'-3' exoribonuclease 2
MRANPDYHKDTTTVIYGLDADLIMLSLNHLHITKQLYLHRETPEFIKNIDSSLDSKLDYLFCIQTLNNAIEKEIGDSTHYTGGANIPLTYVFMCFLLGNDFLPHFPALNIRTNGIDKLLNAYKLVKNPSFFASASGNTSASSSGSSKSIIFNWKNIRTWIDVLAKQEHENIKEEYVARSNFRFMPTNKDETLEEKYDKTILQYPMREREIEEYINPNEPGWEKRYYRTLFNINIDDARRKEICMNYLEGLEWTTKYYTSGCPDWNWKYKYNYPPLLTDLIKYVPYFETTLINPTNKQTYAVTPLVQLSYVLPRASLYLLPDVIHRALLKTHPEWYGADYPLVWAYCKYIWESHVTFPEIDMNELKNVVESVTRKDIKA